MGLVAMMSLYFLVAMFFVYFCIIADPNTSRIARFLTQDMPDFFIEKLTKCLGPKLATQLVNLSFYSLQILYLVVVLGTWSVMFSIGYPAITQSKYVSSWHKYVGYVVFLLCMGSFRYACVSNPGFITQQTIPKFDNYEYDELLFASNRICPTKGIRKLARSKYDRFTKQHVARFDHFCGWLMNPIGEENYRYFLLFLFVHVGMCWYGTAVCVWLFRGEIIEKNLTNAVFYNTATGEEMKADKFIIFQYLLFRHFYLSAVSILLAVMSVALALFLGYHLWITACGMTTNEHVKWQAIRKWHKEETKRYKAALKKAGMVAETPHHDYLTVESSMSRPVVSDDGDVGCTGGAVAAVPSLVEGGEGELNTDEGSDTKNVSSKEIRLCPLPKNQYNRGIVENFLEVIFPRSLRKDALERYARSLREETNGEADAQTSTSTAVTGKSKAS